MSDGEVHVRGELEQTQPEALWCSLAGCSTTSTTWSPVRPCSFNGLPLLFSTLTPRYISYPHFATVHTGYSLAGESHTLWSEAYKFCYTDGRNAHRSAIALARELCILPARTQPMATTMARMPSTPGAGPSSSSISRTASSSSRAPSNASASDDEEEWLGPFRSELRRNREARFNELLQQAEAGYQDRIDVLSARFPHVSGGGASDANYQAAKAKLDRQFETQKGKIRRLLEQEEKELIERERGLRRLSMGGQVESEEAEALIREQEELLKMYQARAHRQEPAGADSSEMASLPSTSPRIATWAPSARSVTSLKSNAPEVSPGISRDRRGSSAMPKPSTSITEDLFPTRNQQPHSQSQSSRYSPWDSVFPSSSCINEEPREMSDTESDDKTDRASDNGDGEEDSGSASEGDASGSDDELSMAGTSILAAEHACSVPTKTAPLNIIRGSVVNHQPSSRGRNGMTGGRTPPSAMSIPYSANTAAPNTQSYIQSASYKNTDAQHRLWKPSQENMRQQSMSRRPSVVDPYSREQERLREADRSWAEHENARARHFPGVTSGAPGTSVSPPTHGLAPTSFVPSSAAAFAQSQRTAEVPAQIWKPPENKGIIPVVSNVYVTTGSSGTVSSFSPTISPAPSVHSYRGRNDSDTSAGPSGRRPSQQHQSQATQPASNPRTSLPISTPAISTSRRSPIPVSDQYTTSPSPPVTTPLSTSSSRRSPFVPRPPSPSPLPIPINAPGSSLSRQSTEVSDSDPIARETKPGTKPFGSFSRGTTKSRPARQVAEEGPPVAFLPSGSLTENLRDQATTSALSERMARERDRERDAEQRQNEGDETVDRQAGELRQREEMRTKLEAERQHKEREEYINRQAEELRRRTESHERREAELSARMRESGFEATGQQEQPLEEQQLRGVHDEFPQGERVDQERKMREEHEAALLARESEFMEQRRVLEAQRQRESELRTQKERELAEKEEELSRHKRKMEESYRIRQERDIAEQTRQLELLKKKEAELERQYRLLEAQRKAELEEQRRKEEDLVKKLEELKLEKHKLQEEQQRKEAREREEALRKQKEEERLAEQRRREDEIRAKEDELKQKAWDLHQREEALARRRKEEELLAKEEALERQRRELQVREEELARREEEEEKRRNEESRRKEKELTLRRQREEEDKKRVEVHVLKKLEKEKEEERQKREKEDRDRERKEKETNRERDRRRQRELEEERRMQEFEQQRRQKEEDDMVPEEQVGEESIDIKEQEELVRFFEKRKLQSEARRRDPRGAASSSSFSSSIPSSSFSSAAAFHSGRATSSASSIHSNWSQRSSASSASSGAASDFSRASTGSSATSAWSSTSRPTNASAGSSSSSRTATSESQKTPPGAWKTSNTSKPGAAQSPSAAGMGSYTSSSPLDDDEARAHAEWHRKQEENARRQQEQFRRDSLRQEQERMAQAAAAGAARAGGREQIARAWAAYESAWSSLKDRELLFFRTIPWPVLRQPSDPEDLTTHAIGTFVLSPAHSDKKSARDRLKEQLLRWHPDRFESKWLTKVVADDKDLVRRAAGMVARALNDLNTRESNDPFS